MSGIFSFEHARRGETLKPSFTNPENFAIQFQCLLLYTLFTIPQRNPKMYTVGRQIVIK
jgi:hypothetical protein